MKIQIPISYKVAVFGLLALGAIIYPNRTKAEWANFDNFFHAKIDLIDIGKHPGPTGLDQSQGCRRLQSKGGHDQGANSFS